MKQIKSLSDKRIIVTAKLNGMNANLLVDTGATIAILSDRIRRKYKLSLGRDYHLPIVGAGVISTQSIATRLPTSKESLLHSSLLPTLATSLTVLNVRLASRYKALFLSPKCSLLG